MIEIRCRLIHRQTLLSIPITMTAPSPLSKQLVCPNCSGSLTFDPRTKQLSCSYCGASQALPKTSGEKPSEQSFDDFGDGDTSSPSALSNTAMEVQCPGCQAQITFEPPDVAGDCPFCGTHIVTQPQHANPTIAPNGIIPFQFGQKEAQEKIRQWLRTLRFAPTGLKKLAQHEDIQGIYLPFWTFDCNTQSRYTGKQGTTYYVEVSYTETDSNGNTETKTRQEERVRWKDVSGSVSYFCDDVLVAATYAVDKKRLEELKPWDFNKLLPYHPSYLAGFKAQRSEANLNQAFAVAKEEGIRSEVYAAIRRDIGGDRQQVNSAQIEYTDVTFKHILLPVWIASYRYKSQTYQVVINAQTGEVLGDRPWNQLRRMAPAIAAGFVGLLAVLTQCADGILDMLPEGAEPSPPTPQPTEVIPPASQPPSPAAPSSSSPSPASPSPASQPEPTLSPSDIAFREAINRAGQAANLTQTAQTPQDWQQVEALWTQSIELLLQVQPDHPNAETARQKVQEYQVNLNYARQQADQ